MSDDSKPNSPRKFQRLRTLKGARLEFDGALTFDVLIRDMSEGGVKLKLGTAFVVPARFELVIFNPNTGIIERRYCELRWQRGDQIGAQFLEPPPSEEPPASQSERFRRLARPG